MGSTKHLRCDTITSLCPTFQVPLLTVSLGALDCPGRKQNQNELQDLPTLQQPRNAAFGGTDSPKRTIGKPSAHPHQAEVVYIYIYIYIYLHIFIFLVSSFHIRGRGGGGLRLGGRGFMHRPSHGPGFVTPGRTFSGTSTIICSLALGCSPLIQTVLTRDYSRGAL